MVQAAAGLEDFKSLMFNDFSIWRCLAEFTCEKTIFDIFGIGARSERQRSERVRGTSSGGVVVVVVVVVVLVVVAQSGSTVLNALLSR